MCGGGEGREREREREIERGITHQVNHDKTLILSDFIPFQEIRYKAKILHPQQVPIMRLLTQRYEINQRCSNNWRA